MSAGVMRAASMQNMFVGWAPRRSTCQPADGNVGLDIARYEICWIPWNPADLWSGNPALEIEGFPWKPADLLVVCYRRRISGAGILRWRSSGRSKQLGDLLDSMETGGSWEHRSCIRDRVKSKVTNQSCRANPGLEGGGRSTGFHGNRRISFIAMQRPTFTSTGGSSVSGWRSRARTGRELGWDLGPSGVRGEPRETGEAPRRGSWVGLLNHSEGSPLP